MARLHAQGVLRGAAGQGARPHPAERAAEHATLLGLLELVARVGVVQEVGEVGEKLELRTDGVGTGAPLAIVFRLQRVPRQAGAAGLAMVGGVDGVEATDLPAVDRALRHLVGAVPLGGVGHQRERLLDAAFVEAVAQQAVEALEVLGVRPGAVVVGGLDRGQQRARGQCRGLRHQGAGVAVLAQREAGHAAVRADRAAGQGVHQLDARGAGRAEVAVFRGVHALAVADAADQFGDEEVQVAVALAVGVGGHVHRHAVEEGGEVGAVVEIEAAQVVLVGFAVAAVLRDDDAGHELQHLGGAQGGAALDELGRDRALAGRGAAAHGVVVVAFDDDFSELALGRMGQGVQGDAGQGQAQQAGGLRDGAARCRWRVGVGRVHGGTAEN